MMGLKCQNCGRSFYKKTTEIWKVCPVCGTPFRDEATIEAFYRGKAKKLSMIIPVGIVERIVKRYKGQMEYLVTLAAGAD